MLISVREVGIESSKCIYYEEFDFVYERSVSLGMPLIYLKRFVLEICNVSFEIAISCVFFYSKL